MTKQWLTRRAVRSPVSRRTTAPISSSVCRLPFISASALPSRTSATAFSAESWLCGGVDDRQARDVDAFAPARPPRSARAARPGSARSARASPRRPRRAASSRRRDARRPSASAAAPCRRRAGAGISRACVAMRSPCRSPVAAQARLRPLAAGFGDRSRGRGRCADATSSISPCCEHRELLGRRLERRRRLSASRRSISVSSRSRSPASTAAPAASRSPARARSGR